MRARLALLLPLAVACSRAPEARRDPSPAPIASASVPQARPSASAAESAPPAPALEGRLRARAARVLAALKAKDGKALAALADPIRGVRFSPYGYVDTAHDVVLGRAQLVRAMTDPTKRTWGTYDGRGTPIVETYAQYYRAFVWTHDFTTAPDVAVDHEIGSGNTISNIATAYPKGHFVELHFPGFDKKLGGMDWDSLRLVFEDEPVDGGHDLMLVGIVHASWTI
jgi:hypothetical protein